MIEKTTTKLFPTLASAEYIYGDGNFILKPFGRIAGVEIWFQGVPSINTMLPDGWNMKFITQSMAIIWSTDSYEPLPEVLFEYEGVFHVKHCLCIDYHENRIICKGKNPYISTWKKLYSKWDYAGGYKQYKVNYLIGNVIKKRKIKKKERNAEGGYTTRVPLSSTEAVSSAYEGGMGGGGGL